MDPVSLSANRARIRFGLIGLVVIVLSLVVPIRGASGATGSTPNEAVHSFVALALRGISGTFSEEYRVSQGPLSGQVELAQEEPLGRHLLTSGPARWSFLYQSEAGTSNQWIENGSRVWDCFRKKGMTKWTCSGPAQYEDSNGFAFATTPYIPGVVLDDIDQLKNGPRAQQVGTIAFSTMTSPTFGPLRCMKTLGITSCLDKTGALVSQQGGPYWTTITLLHRSASVPTSAFTLKGTSTSSGRNFTLFLA